MEIQNREQIIQQISEFIDGTLVEKDQSKFLELMQADESVRELYTEMMAIDSMLDWQQPDSLDVDSFSLNQMASPKKEASKSEVSLRRRIVTLQFSIAGLLLLCIALGSSLFLKGSSPVVAASVTEEGEAIAYVARLTDVKWTSTDSSAHAGELLRPGWLKFSRGRVEVDFLQGTNVIIEGPAEIGLKGINRLYLKSGTIMVQSNSEGFSVETVSQILKTENALVGITAGKSYSEFHLFSGTASFQKQLKSESLQSLDINKAVKIANTFGSALNEIEIEPGQFPTFETIRQSEPQPSINFQKRQPIAYGYQDGQHDLKTESSISENGQQLNLNGNSWKMVKVDSDITENTVLEFEFRSDSEGQIHGVGFDNDDRYHTDKDHVLFQIFGFEVRNGIGQQFNSYKGNEWKTFQIRVGRYIKGPHKYLYFVADDDVTGDANSQFRNVKVFEAK